VSEWTIVITGTSVGGSVDGDVSQELWTFVEHLCQAGQFVQTATAIDEQGARTIQFETVERNWWETLRREPLRYRRCESTISP